MTGDFVPSSADVDPVETQEWLDALHSVVSFESTERAQFIVGELLTYAQKLGIKAPAGIHTPYINTLTSDQPLPDKSETFNQLINYMRWNAIVMVMRANKESSELGGHIASYASIATLFEVGFNYFFHTRSKEHGGDLVFFQGHSSPGIYARAFLEGRLNEKQLDHFRQEALNKESVSSYPHPWLMPDFWQFPTVSMGLGPIMAIYQARFLKYTHHRSLMDNTDRKVWAFCGDGEMSEPESQGILTFAAREKLDNLIFIVNCNLQRLDGPVFGNGQIIQELEGVFRGAGWNVIKIIWGSGWDRLFEKDKTGLLIKRIGELIDGEYQNYSAKGGAYLREHFFGKYPELAQLVEDLSDEDLTALQDGGHDPQKVYSAYQQAVNHKGQPTVILAKTVKGYGMGKAGQASNVTHQTKKMNTEALMEFRDRFNLPLSDKQVENLEYLKLPKGSAEEKLLLERRESLGGGFPKRVHECEKLKIPSVHAFDELLKGSDGREISTTLAFTRILNALLKDDHLKERIVPIVADESRTFGMEGLFRKLGIYSIYGQQYEPEDRKTVMYYREDQTGQLLQEGLNEAGAMSSWVAAATSYSSNQFPMIPFYIYYSMFGYQRVGDLVWAAGDMSARGFILGGTAGRTTLAGEGLQHQDGHNLIAFSFVPNCISYDPTFAYELAVIMHDGLVRMYQKQENVFYYITAMNENYQHPPMPKGVEKDIIKGMYLFSEGKKTAKTKVQLLGSGTILREVIAAAEILQNEFDVAADVWSVTSFNELRKECESVARYNRLHPDAQPKQSHVTQCLQGRKGPVIAATDYMKLFADQIRSDISAPYHVLGTDGYGRSDTRKVLRDFFEVDAKMVAYTALKALADLDQFPGEKLKAAIKSLNIDTKRPDPNTV